MKKKHRKEKQVGAANRSSGVNTTLNTAIDRFLAAKSAMNLTSTTIAHYRCALKSLANKTGEISLCEITPGDVMRFLEDHDSWSAATYSRTLATLRRFFAWVISSSEFKHFRDPCRRIRNKHVAPKITQTLSVAACGELMSDAESAGCDSVPMALALCLFAGLRHSELGNIKDVASISTCDRLVVNSDRNGSLRFVEICKNLREWLTKYPPTAEAMEQAAIGSSVISRFLRPRGVTLSALRSTFIAAYSAKHEVVNTALTAGIRPPLVHHYCAKMTGFDAQRFFEIVPLK